MALLRRQKLTIILLVFYWPTLFILAHIPVPQLVRKANVSDKGLHFLAYLILTFLFWSTTNPYKKVSWRKATAWLALLALALYGICDELLQGCIQGRSCDAMDFVANLAGMLAALIMLSVFNFQPASLMVTGVTIFGLTNIARVSIADLLPVTNITFHLFGYAFFTLLWIQYIHHFSSLKIPKTKWLIAASIPPTSLLLAVKAGSLILGRSFTITDIIASAIGIATVTVTIALTAFFRQRPAQTEKPPPIDG